MTNKPSWVKAPNIKWETKVAIWGRIAKGESSRFIAEQWLKGDDTDDTAEGFVSRDTVDKIREELPTLPKGLVDELPEAIREYWCEKQVNNDKADYSKVNGLNEVDEVGLVIAELNGFDIRTNNFNSNAADMLRQLGRQLRHPTSTFEVMWSLPDELSEDRYKIVWDFLDALEETGLLEIKRAPPPFGLYKSWIEIPQDQYVLNRLGKQAHRRLTEKGQEEIG